MMVRQLALFFDVVAAVVVAVVVVVVAVVVVVVVVVAAAVVDVVVVVVFVAVVVVVAAVSGVDVFCLLFRLIHLLLGTFVYEYIQINSPIIEFQAQDEIFLPLPPLSEFKMVLPSPLKPHLDLKTQAKYG
jgi:hypothetical protein